MGINPNGHMRNPVSSLYNHTNMAAAAAVNASPSAFALMGAHQQHQLLQARMAASNLALAANAASAAAAAASIGSSTSPGSTNSSPDEKNSSTSSSSGGDTPMSRTNQYKKVTTHFKKFYIIIVKNVFKSIFKILYRRYFLIYFCRYFSIYGTLVHLYNLITPHSFVLFRS